MLAATLLLLLLTVFNASATDIFFDMTQVFGIQPPYNTGRVARLQSLSPFAGNYFYRTSDVSGQFYVSNALATTYSGTILAPPNSLTFSFYVSATNLGVVPAQGITSIPANGVNTYPAGQTAYSAQASDQRYAPITSGPFSALTAAQSTNLTVAATNNLLAALTNSLEINTIRADNLILPFGNALMKANGVSNAVPAVSGTDYDAPGAAVAIGAASTNYTLVASNALYTQIGAAGISAATATNISTNQVFLGTNAIGLGSGLSAYVPTNRIVTPNYPFIWTNAGGYVSNASGYVFSGSNGLYVNSNIVTGTSFVLDTNKNWSLLNGGSVTASNNAATGNYRTMGNIAAVQMSSSGASVFGSVSSAGAGLFGDLLYNNDGNYGDLAADGGWTANYFIGNGYGLTNTTATNFGPAGLVVITNISKSMTGLTNAVGTNFPNGKLVNQTLFYPTNDLSITSNGLVAQMAVLAPTNAPTLYNPAIIGANLSSSTNYTAYFYHTPPTVVDSSIGTGITGLTISPFVGGGGVLLVSGNLLVTNGITASGGKFSGNGWGITNASTTNIQGAGLVQVTNIAASLIGSSVGVTNAIGTNFPNGSIANATLFYPTNFVNPSSGTATNLTVTNLISVQGSIAFGFNGGATNIYSSTNVLKVFNAGTAVATNGTLVWSSALGCYTNWSTAAIYTNNGSAWLLQTNGVTLYSLSGSNPSGTSSAVSGSIPAPTIVVGAYLDGNGFAIFGPLSVTNIAGISNALYTNITTIVTNNFIANNNGVGTNTALYFTSAAWGLSNYFVSGTKYGSALLSGVSNKIDFNGTYSTIVGGIQNRIVGPASGDAMDFVGGGRSNYISESYLSAIVGGFSNTVVGNSSSILGGEYNAVANTVGLVSSDSTIAGGSYNLIAPPSTAIVDLIGSSVTGGSSNVVKGSYSTAGGLNVNITNENTWAWSDGKPLNSRTNSTFLIQTTNGVGINTNYASGFALSVGGVANAASFAANNGVYYLSNASFSLPSVTNGMANFAHWVGNSNGLLIDLYYSNGVPFFKTLGP